MANWSHGATKYGLAFRDQHARILHQGHAHGQRETRQIPQNSQ